MSPSELAGLAGAQLWQLTALIVVVAAVVRMVGRKRPHLAHVLWLVVLAKCLTPPVIASAGSVFSWLQPVHWTARSEWAELEESLPSHGKLPTGLTALLEANRTSMNTDGATGTTEQADAASSVGTIVFGTSPRADFRRTTSRRDVMFRWSGTIWIAGSLLLVAIALFRWGMCLREIRSAPVIARPDLDRLVAELAKRLRVGRSVRLLVTDSRIGPAVVGLFRPLILLPLAIAEGKSARELEAVVAHELLHVRRGDLWIGLVQVVAQGVWWFHPLVWLANRRATRAAEACCDEEVVAELRCDPAAYAGSLLEVLELKRRLVSVPAFPGMRPVDVTRERLERIMQFGQGCRRATPWWCWIVLVLAAIGTLPGAALVVSAEKEKQNEQRQPVDPHRGTNIDNLNARSNGSLGVQIPDRSCRFQIGKFCVEDGDTGKIRDLAIVSETLSPVSEKLPTKLFSIVADHIELECHVLSVLFPHLRCRNHVQLSFENVEVTADNAVVIMLKSRTALAPTDDKEILSIHLTGNVRWTCGKWKAGAEDVQFAWGEYREGDTATLRLAYVKLEGLFEMEGFGSQIRGDRAMARYSTATGSPEVHAAVPRLPDSIAVDGNVVIWRRNADQQPCVLRSDRAEVFLQDDSIQVREPDRKAVAVPKADLSATTLVGTGVNSEAGLVGTVSLPPVEVSKRPAKDEGEFSTVTYSVADLIVPRSRLRVIVTPKDDEKQETISHLRDESQATFEPLIELIQATTGHEFWMEFGGSGSIRQFPTTLSLVARATPAVHDEIGRLLKQLRHLQSLQTKLDVELFHFVGHSIREARNGLTDRELTEAARRGVMASEEQIRALRKLTADKKDLWHNETVKLMLHNGQGAELVLRGLWKNEARPPLMQLGAVVSQKRDSLRLTIAAGVSNPFDAPAQSRAFVIKDRQSLLLDVTDAIKAGRLGVPIESSASEKVQQLTRSRDKNPAWQQTLLLITPEILPPEEEELLLERPAP